MEIPFFMHVRDRQVCLKYANFSYTVARSMSNGHYFARLRTSLVNGKDLG
ncbi:hypothetical protein LYSBPC_03420 [Lysinibacillus piscis]|uniref:Uncharacterized protein n=1 Tax=Lysinibacillus piscis TaxID=2518931 RepID=A0ABQ5NG14_9BACI|nr:hypothetical protein LYSBPC_03420 [Lysinibacillus sp. KH24]